ncbi:TPA: 3-oxoacyl-ACP reductase FabG [Campylobacter fetus subsp. venerealis]|uniref:3-oxoacyl-[acyl-carrier-protein] reductase n=1 Tax=Campylobacter fetus subsp. venerealis NCTC 10354 TaxID=983328 RepID=A0AAE6MA34_CAMFE|nr:3-oxoacyl-ACP reductase FabG [Campylobacter fetus]OCS22678.1 beta-ketoacyl-ACP reductase [Campylobacter fetus subsp. venerealis cfvi97/532]OCS26895.1 beta-ketoacyl-ACP reductase [Campylobacter fetus subsp. venerealis cfvB10]OCS30028.1 beta-ketoacyl-ACP reductase [Campylobacter fetus subsp. venerealis LMG 6570 = CCUG 33900]OCS42316.1 beta-ketoacyl-ACP reductase [Campylobacter fetus subsp. venerealis cfvi02/298]AHE94688.1 3-oxoacyl-[acp] reductase [Campylobacter fetus subsp. venerealis cfvi03
MKFSGKNVLVTGASRGIGAEICKVLAGFGLKVWINYRSKPELADSLKDEIEKSGGKAAVIKFDAANEDEFIEAINLIVQSDSELSYLVNNAGITNDKLAIRMKTEEFVSILDANLKSAFIGSKEALKVMSKKRFGAVVNVASIVGEMGNAGQTNYAASKGGMIAMSKSFAKEGAARNVRYNCVAPGFIQTDMTNVLSEEVKSNYIANIPLKRLGEAKEVANSVAFLLSDYSSYITGDVLKINGGLYM